MQVDRALAYDDVLDAWNYYLQHDNNGRGVVLIGHSQGSGVLTQLIRNEIDGKPVQSRLISALLLGTSLAVPKGKDVGGAFQHVPLCHSATDTGCVIRTRRSGRRFRRLRTHGSAGFRARTCRPRA